MLRKKGITARDGFVRGNQVSGGKVAKRSLLLVLIATLLVFLAVPLLGRNGLAAWFDLRRQEHDLQREVQTLAAENAVLDQQLEALADDPATLEKLARQQHNMRRPDEKVLHVVE